MAKRNGTIVVYAVRQSGEDDAVDFFRNPPKMEADTCIECGGTHPTRVIAESAKVEDFLDEACSVSNYLGQELEVGKIYRVTVEPTEPAQAAKAGKTRARAGKRGRVRKAGRARGRRSRG